MRRDWIRRFRAAAALLGLLLACVCAGAAEEAGGEHKPNMRYKVTVHNKDGGEDEKIFDLSKDADAKEVARLFGQGHIESMALDKPPDFLALKWDLALWSIVVFLGLLWILNKVAWGPMLQGLQNREKSIRQALDDAEQSKRETAELRQKLQSEMDKANDKVRQMLEEGQRAAQRTADELLAKTRADISSERERLRREMDIARDQAIKELWEQTAKLATEVSAKVVGRQLNADDHRRLVDETLTGLRHSANDMVRSN
jgi:F-type H+-transporting ATPase subunit b